MGFRIMVCSVLGLCSGCSGSAQACSGSAQACSGSAQVKAAVAHVRRLKQNQRNGELILSLAEFSLHEIGVCKMPRAKDLLL
jgi:hypothetical protein